MMVVAAEAFIVETEDGQQRLLSGVETQTVKVPPFSPSPKLDISVDAAEAFIEEDEGDQRRLLSKMETLNVLDEIEATFQEGGAGAHLRWSHRWQPGDFIIADNLAVGHEASPDTQRPPSQVGLRVMHRCTVAGTATPQKMVNNQGQG